ncbi:MAG: DUF2088 domain-containing protein [Armatimonadota bacterium]|nr:DUF2088 domain-containing protein [Armatimonadota bacterium]
MRVVRYRFPRPRVPDPARAVADALASLDLSARVRGRRIAMTAGSRGIANIATVLEVAAAVLRDLGAQPVVVAAMGSHGGGTREGQRRVLAHLGITEESIGAPVSTGTESVVVGRTPDGLAAFCDATAASCDGILVVNRIKPHTAFAEPFGSGLMKMLAVGLGHVEGAAQVHRLGPARLPEAIRAIAQVHLDAGTVVGGVAILENACGDTARVEAVAPVDLIGRELELFKEARLLLPRLPVDELDVLVVDEMGKVYAGTGMDTTVIGRYRIPGLPEPSAPRIQRIVVLRLSPRSEGNAQGIGLADLTTQRLVDAMDRRATYLNTVTSTFLSRGFIPITLPSDREAIATALDTLGLDDPRRARLIRIPNTAHLERLLASETVVEGIRGQDGVEVGPEVPWEFAPDGNLADLA